MSETHFWQGFWRLADPKISLASFAGLFMAACMAAADGPLAWPWLLLTVAGVFAVEVAKNASGEIVDFDGGTDLAVTEQDRTPFSGGKRVLVERLLNRKQAQAIAAVAYSIAIVIGLLIVIYRDARVLWFGIAGLGLAWFYHSGPLRLAYRGWGELAVALAYGPLVVVGTYLVQTATLTASVMHASITLGLLVMAFLWINEFPDYRADKACGKNNLVVKLGRQRAVFVYICLPLLAYSYLAFVSLSGEASQGLLWGLLGAPAALFSVYGLLTAGAVTHKMIPAQAACLASFVFMAVAAGLGTLLV